MLTVCNDTFFGNQLCKYEVTLTLWGTVSVINVRG
jgi:hypothetical protein